MLIINKMKTIRKSFIESAIGQIMRGEEPDYSLFPELKQGRDEMINAGMEHRLVNKAFYIPAGRSTVTAGSDSATAGISPIFPEIVDTTILTQLGVTEFPGLAENQTLPIPGASIPLWPGEVADATDIAPTLGTISYSPRRITGYQDVSRTLAVQSPNTLDWLTGFNILKPREKLESTIFGIAAGSALVGQGLGYKVTTGTSTAVAAGSPSPATLEALITAVDTAGHLNRRCVFVTSWKGFKVIMDMLRIENGGISSAFTRDPQLYFDGFPVFVSPNVSNIAGTGGDGALLIFGDWGKLGICRWGGTEIMFDPYVRAKNNIIRIIISAYYDFKGMAGQLTTGPGTDDDMFAYAFASTAIK
jgi:hypothetical protein